MHVSDDAIIEFLIFVVVGLLFVIGFMYQDIVEKRNYIKKHVDPKEVLKKAKLY